MTSERSDYVIDIARLPGSENASRFDGHEHGVSVSFFISRNRPGTGPDLHRHPYEETFIVLDGKVRFTIGEETIEATAGQIVVVLAGMAHKFVSTGAGRLKQISIHPAARMETEWLE
ncbi:MAG: cupin domain-containing protein [Actinomycetota bacterium]|nr:cupin domain-containing protein [Actinomycetota bacterium]